MLTNDIVVPRAVVNLTSRDLTLDTEGKDSKSFNQISSHYHLDLDNIYFTHLW